MEGMSISADNITYSEDGASMEAYGSVEVVSSDTSIDANHVVCYIKDKRVVADGGFSMILTNGFLMSGEAVDYSFITRKGETRKVKIRMRNNVIGGELARFDDEKVELQDASFNTCGLEPPHYHVSSATTTLYPEDGWVLGYWGYLWLGNFPLLPVPIYLYDISSSVSGQKADATSVVSFPQVGSNDQDGFYVLYKIPWIANKKLNGSVTLLNTAKGGFGGGVEANYAYSEVDDSNYRIFYDPRYNTFGGLTNTYRFGPKLGQTTQSIYTFLHIKQQLAYEFVTNISYKERINYERVTMFPDLTLRVNPIPAFFEHFTIGGEVSYGHITEESSGSNYDRGRIITNSGFDFPTDYANVHIGFGYNQSWYSQVLNWTRWTYDTRFSRDLGYGLDGYVYNLHYLDYNGNSPFNYELYLTAPSDEFGFGLGYNFGWNRLTVDYSYYVPSWDVRDLQYGLSIGFHCYTIDLKYSTSMKALTFGVGLITR